MTKAVERERGGARRVWSRVGRSPASEDLDDYAWFFRAEFPAVVRTALLIVRDRGRAEEIAQEAFMRLHMHWRTVSRYERPDAWVRRVAIRLAARAAGRERARPSLEQAAAGPRVGDAPATDIDLLRAIGELPMRQRIAVVLFYLEDRPLPEIAHVLDCTDGAAKTLLYRARVTLADQLGEEVDDVDRPTVA